MRICFATNNQHKLNEVRELLDDSLEVVGMDELGCTEELSETQETLEGNSMQKAAYVFEHFHIPCFADDTGLEVAALGGAPGVYSARFAGSQRNSGDNMKLLLERMKGKTDRQAQFRTVITFMDEDGAVQMEGVLKGTIIESPRGTAGFGYDPVFLPEGRDITLAEMTMEDKNLISHRGHAIRKLVNFLKHRHLQSL